jgi:hypothetical protein
LVDADDIGSVLMEMQRRQMKIVEANEKDAEASNSN